jgi:hypothetical protein
MPPERQGSKFMIEVARRLSRLAIAFAALLPVAACTLTQGPPAISPTKVFSMSRAPERGTEAKFAFAPVAGIPTELLQTLNSTVAKHATARHLNVVPIGDPTATYTVKGYLSAIGDSRSTLLVYVWDVFDRDGTRLRRVSGQEIGKGASTDPWTGISEETVANVVRSTIDELAAWSS